MVAIKEVLENDDIVVVTSQGVVIRQPAKTIRIAGRNTQGVRLIRLDEKDRIAAIAVVPSEDDKEVEAASAAAPPPPAPLKQPEPKKQEVPQATLFEKQVKPTKKKAVKKKSKR
jgi:DNA gyrase/topoisomerase IV subunit A